MCILPICLNLKNPKYIFVYVLLRNNEKHVGLAVDARGCGDGGDNDNDSYGYGDSDNDGMYTGVCDMFTALFQNPKLFITHFPN